MSEQKEKRTVTQNNAMHKYFELLAQALNDAGYDMKVMIELAPKMSADWTKTAVKEKIWKEFQDAMLSKKSTTKLETEEVSKIYENVNRRISELTGVTVPFPSMNQMLNESTEAV